MAPKSYGWITAWMLFAAPVMLYDAGYCLLRPRTLPGGDLHWLWSGYEWYEKVDHVYAESAFRAGEGFANAAGLLNLIETFQNLVYLYLVYINPSDIAPLFGYAAAAMTLSKTVLYCAQEYYCGWCAVGHNPFMVILGSWIAPNFVWATLSLLIMIRLGGDMHSMMKSSSKGKMKAV